LNGRILTAQSGAFNAMHPLKGDAMFEGLLQPMHLILIAGIALLILGPKKLPELGRGIGESIKGFKASMAADDPAPQPAAAKDVENNQDKVA
jgi:sec-independent protein translocase protein TatA